MFWKKKKLKKVDQENERELSVDEVYNIKGINLRYFNLKDLEEIEEAYFGFKEAKKWYPMESLDIIYKHFNLKKDCFILEKVNQEFPGFSIRTGMLAISIKQDIQRSDLVGKFNTDESDLLKCLDYLKELGDLNFNMSWKQNFDHVLKEYNIHLTSSYNFGDFRVTEYKTLPEKSHFNYNQRIF